MCATCGCGEAEHRLEHSRESEHQHEHGNEHQHERGHEHQHDSRHDPEHEHQHRLKIEREVLEKNARLAERNRGFFAARGVLALNLVSAPGSGKTTLLERTIREAGLPACVIEGDQATELDARRIRAAGARSVQINTGAGCHLDAEMVARALPELRPEAGTIVFIENVGNLVCPALFDLGESAKVLIASVTEGDDKPLKYPHMFRAADLVVLNKIDLLPHVAFDVARFEAAASEVNPRLTFIRLSAARGEGVPAWYRYLSDRAKAVTSA